MRYKLLFRGQVAADQHVSVVRPRLQKLLKASDAQLEVMFSGKPVSIKKDADEATAERYLDAFMKAGAKLEIVELDAAALAEAARKAEMTAAAEAHKAKLAKETEEAAQQASAPVQQPGAQAETQEATAPGQSPSGSAALNQTAGATAAFALAEVGADLVPAAAKTPEPVVSVATDHLSLAEAGGNLMEATEAPQAAPPPDVDTSHLSLDEAGATLGVPTGAGADIEALIEFDFELGEVGELLVESTPPVVAEIPDLGHFELEQLAQPEPADEELA